MQTQVLNNKKARNYLNHNSCPVEWSLPRQPATLRRSSKKLKDCKKYRTVLAEEAARTLSIFNHCHCYFHSRSCIQLLRNYKRKTHIRKVK